MTMRKLLLAFGLVLAACPAWGQQISPLEPPDIGRYLRWGPVRVRPSIAIPAIGYDSNVYYTTGNQPNVGDYFAALVPRAQGVVLFGHRAFLTFDERLEFYGYARQHSANYYNQLGNARLTVPFSRWGLYGDVGYDRVRDRPVDAQDQRPIRIERPLGGGLILKLGWRTDAEIGFTRARATASDPDEVVGCDPNLPTCFTIAHRNNRDETGVRVLARYLVFGRTRLVLQASDRKIVFDDAAVGRDARERRILPGMDFGLGGRVYGSFHVGYSSFDLKDPAAVDFRGVIADAAVGYKLGGLGSFVNLVATRDVRFTLYETTELYRYTNGDLTFVKYFNRLLGIEVGGGEGNVVFIGDPTGRHYAITRESLGVRVRLSENALGRRVEYAFRYVYSQLNATCGPLPGSCDYLDQNRGTVGFGVTYGY
jgi:Putative beta-barrel porin 2